MESNGKENKGKTLKNNKTTAQNDPKDALRYPPYIPLYSLKGTPRSQEPWVSKWKLKEALAVKALTPTRGGVERESTEELERKAHST